MGPKPPEDWQLARHSRELRQDPSLLQAEGAHSPTAEAAEDGRAGGVEGDSTRGLIRRREVVQLESTGREGPDTAAGLGARGRPSPPCPACLWPFPTCRRVARSQMRTVWSKETVASCPRLRSVESASTGAMWERASTVYSRDGMSRKPRWPEEVVDSTRRPSGLKQTELTGPSCSVGKAGSATPRLTGTGAGLGRRATVLPGTEVPETDDLLPTGQEKQLPQDHHSRARGGQGFQGASPRPHVLLQSQPAGISGPRGSRHSPWPLNSLCSPETALPK